MLPYAPGAKLLLAASDGRGFVVPADEVLAPDPRRQAGADAGRGRAGARSASPAEGDTVAVVGENRKLLIFPLAEVPEMARGRGVILQRYHDGGLADVKVFT